MAKNYIYIYIVGVALKQIYIFSINVVFFIRSKSAFLLFLKSYFYIYYRYGLQTYLYLHCKYSLKIS